MKKKSLCFLFSLCVLFLGCSEASIYSEQTGFEATAGYSEREQTVAIRSGIAHDSPVKLLIDTEKSAGQVTENIEQTTSSSSSMKQELEFAPVELVLQNPELPNGCEVTSLAMLLSAAGFPVDHVELYEKCLPTESFTYSKNQRFGPSPEECYIGDASNRTGGWYCFEGPLITAGNDWIRQNDGSTSMQLVSGMTRDDLEQYAQDKNPVIVWVTIGYAQPRYADYFSWIQPNGEQYIPYDNLHCVVLTGEENGQYRIADPIYGWQTVPKDVFWNSFDSMGRRAVTIRMN